MKFYPLKSFHFTRNLFWGGYFHEIGHICTLYPINILYSPSSSSHGHCSAQPGVVGHEDQHQAVGEDDLDQLQECLQDMTSGEEVGLDDLYAAFIPL